MLKNDFENQNFSILDEVLNNFGRSDDDDMGRELSKICENYGRPQRDFYYFVSTYMN